MRVNLGFYIQKINEIVQETEAAGEVMNPYFEEVRFALDEGKSLSTEQLTETAQVFQEGTTKYEEISETITKLKPPVKAMGIHKKLSNTYEAYVSACQEMVEAIEVEEEKINQALFDDSEKKQDETTDTIAFCIQRLTKILM